MGVDDRLAEAERRWREAPGPQTEARWIREALRAGALRRERVALCAELGHEAAWLALGQEAPAPPVEGDGGGDDDGERVEAWALAIGADDDAVRLRAAIAALRAMPVYWHRFDGPDDRLLAAIDAIEAWVRCPCADHAAAAGRIVEGGWIDPASRRPGPYTVAGAMAAAIAGRPIWGPDGEAPSLEQAAADALRAAARSLHFGRLRAALAGELVPWALGRDDPLGERPHRRGERLGSVDAIVRRVAFAPDGRTALSADDRGWLRLWSIDPPAERFCFPRRAGDLYAAAWSPRGDRILIADRWGRLELWDVAGERAAARLAFTDRASPEGSEPPSSSPEDARQVNDLAFADAEGAHAFTAGYDGAVRRWDLATGRVVEVVARFEKSVVAVSVSGDRARLAAVSRDETLAVWDVEGRGAGGAARDPIARIATGRAVEDCALLGPRGDRVVAAGYDGSLTVWDVASGEVVATLEGHESTVYAVAASPDGELLASTGSDDTVRLWETRTGHERERWTVAGVQLAIAFSPDGGRVMVGARSGALRLFRVAGGPAMPPR